MLTFTDLPSENNSVHIEGDSVGKWVWFRYRKSLEGIGANEGLRRRCETRENIPHCIDDLLGEPKLEITYERVNSGEYLAFTELYAFNIIKLERRAGEPSLQLWGVNRLAEDGSVLFTATIKESLADAKAYAIRQLGGGE